MPNIIDVLLYTIPKLYTLYLIDNLKTLNLGCKEKSCHNYLWQKKKKYYISNSL